MNIKLYQNNSEKIQIDKSLTLVKEISGKFKNATNILTPTLIINYDGVIDFNYIYIEELSRYYFVDDISSLNNNLWEIRCSIDCLESYSLGILNLKAYVSRNEKEYSSYIQDKYLITTSKKIYDIINPTDNTLEDSNLFYNLDSFDVNTSPDSDGAPSNISSQTDSFCYTISLANITGGRCWPFDIEEQQDYLKAIGLMEPIQEHQHNRYGPKTYSNVFTNNAFNKVWAINNNTIQALGSLMTTTSSVTGTDRMYSNIGSMINNVKVYPFSIPQYFKLAGFTEENLPQGNFYNDDGTEVVNEYGVSKNIQALTIGNNKISNIITSYNLDSNRCGSETLSGWLLPPQVVNAPIAKFDFTDTSKLYNNYLDYEPYTKFRLYVPMFGYIEIPNNLIINAEIQITLSINFSTGLGVIYIYSTIDNQTTLVTSQQTQLGFDMPIGTSNYAEIERQTTYSTIKNSIRIISGSLIAAGSLVAGITTANPMFIAGALGGATTAGVAATDFYQSNSNPISTTITGGNSENGINNLVAPSGIYILRERVQEYVPQNNYAKYVGLPLQAEKNLSNLHGFTKVGSIHLEGSYFNKATKKELELLENQLKQGFILR